MIRFMIISHLLIFFDSNLLLMEGSIIRTVLYVNEIHIPQNVKCSADVCRRSLIVFITD